MSSFFVKPEKKTSFLGSFFRNITDFTNYFIPGIFGKILTLFIIAVLFLIFAVFDFSPESRLGYAILSGLLISSTYLSYRLWLSGQQKKLLYIHWGVVGKKGLYSSGDVPHMGEVVIELNERLSLNLPAGLPTLEKVVNASVVVRDVTNAGSLIVEAESMKEEAVDEPLVYRHDNLQTIITTLFSKIKKTFLNLK